MSSNLTSLAHGGLSTGLLKKMSSEFRSSSKNILAMNAIARNEMKTVLVNRDVSVKPQFIYSHHLDREAKVTNQKATGRCWLFAALNVFRLDMMKRYKLDDFEFSQSYLFWYDKLEKCAWFLESIIKTANEPLDGRLVQFLLKSPVQDGGQWDMAVSLIEKYGLVPKSAFPESCHSSSSAQLNWLVTVKLREGASVLRKLLETEGIESTKVTEAKEQILTEIYRIMAITLGEPPQSFDWSFRNKDKVFESYSSLSPLSFYRDFVNRDVSKMVSLIHDPRNEYYRLYTVEYLGNVVGGRPVIYLNLPIEELKKYAVKTICGNPEESEKKNSNPTTDHSKPSASVSQTSVSGEPVWFGCDVGKFSDRISGVLDLEYYDYGVTFDCSFGMDKADRLRYGESLMTHAMTLNAVHISPESGKSVRWRVENSWGEARGEKGFFSMTDEWFDEFVYQVVVDKGVLEERVKKVLDTEPIAFPPWDPLGALA